MIQRARDAWAVLTGKKVASERWFMRVTKAGGMSITRGGPQTYASGGFVSGTNGWTITGNGLSQNS